MKNKEEKFNSFDSIEELSKLSLNRLFVLQKLEIRTLENYIINNNCSDDIMNIFKNILTINVIITNKIKKLKNE